jgi:glucose/arabinose dehydrogenase
MSGVPSRCRRLIAAKPAPSPRGVARRARASLLAVAALLPVVLPAATVADSLRFHGNGFGDIDRVKLEIDDPATTLSGPPVDVGATDFTIEFWLKASAAENLAPAVICGANTAWNFGNVVLDRDRYNQYRRFGVSIADGRVVFGVSGDGTGDRTICGASDVLDDAWHHVAVQRRRSDGRMWLFVDGVLEAQADGPGGDVSYPDDGVPGDFCDGPCTASDPFLVIGAEKHDAGPEFPSFSGWIDDVRISTVLRYGDGFTRPHQPFVADDDTVGLYHLDEGSGSVAGDFAGAAGGPNDGVLSVGGSPAGPEWSSEEPPYTGYVTLTLVPLASGLDSVTNITHAGDGSHRLFLTLRNGRILIFDGSQMLATPFLDLSSLVSCCGERGLLGLAFHPNYETNGYFFVNYTNLSGNTVIARYSVSGSPNLANPNSAAVVMTVAQPFSNHNGGQLAFGPDGYLYVALGDGGSGGDPGNRAQNQNDLLGKILRLDIDTGSPYAVPASNPLFGQAGKRGEIWAFGLRNPWRFSFDRRSGDLFAADVGQGTWEEVNVQPAASPGGENYGWRLMEGAHCYDPATGCDPGGLTYPALEYPHTGGNCSVTGGYRYRGALFPFLDGAYLFGDFCTGVIWGGRRDGTGPWRMQQLLDSPYQLATFGEDEQGELYLASFSATGTLYRIEAAPVAGCIASAVPAIAAPTVTSSALPYTVSWSATNPTGTYQVQEATTPTFAGAATFDVTGTSRQFTHVAGGDTTYLYRVRAVDDCSGTPYVSAWSDIVETAVINGCVVEVSDRTVAGNETHESCHTLLAGPNVAVVSPGHLTLRGGTTVVLRNGVSIGPGARLTIALGGVAP